MFDAMLAAEPTIRLAVFAGIFALMALAEALVPHRRPEVGRRVRWPNNLGLVVLDTMMLRVVFPTAAVGAALAAEANGWGLLNLMDLPFWAELLAALLLLDLAIYGQHVLFHAVPVLWRLHRVHHADTHIDVTTGLRFHPVEILLSMAIKLAVVAALGAPALAVLLFEVLLNATAMFNHANLRLPASADRVLRWLIVTPDMHRIHHSARREETDSNFGFNVPLWDRLFGTYRADPQGGQDGMTVGLEDFRTPRDLWLDRLLIQPLRSPAAPKKDIIHDRS